jgi:hypothetical protein
METGAYQLFDQVLAAPLFLSVEALNRSGCLAGFSPAAAPPVPFVDGLLAAAGAIPGVGSLGCWDDFAALRVLTLGP